MGCAGEAGARVGDAKRATDAKQAGAKRADAGGKRKKGRRLLARPPVGQAGFRAWERKRKTGPVPWS